jgi:hypothetical protein
VVARNPWTLPNCEFHCHGKEEACMSSRNWNKQIKLSELWKVNIWLAYRAGINCSYRFKRNTIEIVTIANNQHLLGFLSSDWMFL